MHQHAQVLALGWFEALDEDVLGIIALSLRVSVTASIIAMVIGAPLGVALAISRFSGRRLVIVLVNALLGLPPVVVGLAAYLLLSQSGALASARLLYTPAAMILAQCLLAMPIVVALTHRVAAPLWAEYGQLLQIDGASGGRIALELMKIGRNGMVTVFLAAFGRAIAEVGAIIVVGGNIRGSTRTMTTAIVLATSKGELSAALLLGLVLIVISVGVSAAAFLITGAAARSQSRP